MVMFTETEVLRLRTLSEVSRPSVVDWLIYNALQSELALEDIKAHCNSYLAASISVFNPVSIMSAFQKSVIDNFWVATGLLTSIIFVLHQLSNTQANSLYYAEIFQRTFLPSISLRRFCLMLMFSLNFRIVSPLACAPTS